MDTRGLGWSGAAPDGDYRKATIADDADRAARRAEHRAGRPARRTTGAAWVGLRTRCSGTRSASSGTSPAASCTRGTRDQDDAARRCRGSSTSRRSPRRSSGRASSRGSSTASSAPAWGDRETYDREARADLRRARTRDKGDAGSQYYRQFLAHEVAARPARAAARSRRRLLQGREDPIGTADRDRAGAPRRRRADAPARRLRALRAGGAAG